MEREEIILIIFRDFYILNKEKKKSNKISNNILQNQ
jgi:hypothetical protein